MEPASLIQTHWSKIAATVENVSQALSVYASTHEDVCEHQSPALSCSQPGQQPAAALGWPHVAVGRRRKCAIPTLPVGNIGFSFAQ